MKKTTKKGKDSGDEEFPGYPKYPAEEDIMNRAKRIELDIDETNPAEFPAPISPPLVKTTPLIKIKKKAPQTESDVTKEDLLALKSEENNFEGDDEVLEDRVYPVDFAGQDLDVPGSELDDKAELNGNEDEENNIYSLGGENHEDLEENRT